MSTNKTPSNATLIGLNNFTKDVQNKEIADIDKLIAAAKTANKTEISYDILASRFCTGALLNVFDTQIKAKKYSAWLSTNPGKNDKGELTKSYIIRW